MAKLRSTAAWLLLGIGIAVILGLQVIRIDIVYTNWGWNKSHFAHYLFWPLLAVGFVAVTFAPMLACLPISRRCWLSLAALLIAAAVYFGSSLLILLLYGA